MVDIPEPRKFKLDTDKFSQKTQRAYDAVVKDIQAALYDEEFDLSKIEKSTQAMTQSVQEDYRNNRIALGKPVEEVNGISEAVAGSKVDWAKKILTDKAQADGAPGVGKI